MKVCHGGRYRAVPFRTGEVPQNTVSGKFEVLMADCGEEYAELTDRYVNTLWSRMNKAGMLARIADIRSVLDSEYTPLFNPL